MICASSDNHVGVKAGMREARKASQPLQNCTHAPLYSESHSRHSCSRFPDESTRARARGALSRYPCMLNATYNPLAPLRPALESGV